MRPLISRAGQMHRAGQPGVKPGDRVGAQTEKSVPGLVLYLAGCAGAVYLPLNTAYTLMNWNISSPTRAVAGGVRSVGGHGIGAIAAKSAPGLRRWRRRPGIADDAAPRRARNSTLPADDDLAAILTLGTTGVPRARCSPTTIGVEFAFAGRLWRFTDKTC